MYYMYHDSPLGHLLLAGDFSQAEETKGEFELSTISFPKDRYHQQVKPDWQSDSKPFRSVIEQLEAYFAGSSTHFDLLLKPKGTVFQCQVWTALQRIPYGETWSYGQLAENIGRPTASRAVGAANGANPLPIVIPCHRVIGADGSLTGFGGGLANKRWLLHREGVLPSAEDDSTRQTSLPLFS